MSYLLSRFWVLSRNLLLAMGSAHCTTILVIIKSEVFQLYYKPLVDSKFVAICQKAKEWDRKAIKDTILLYSNSRYRFDHQKVSKAKKKHTIG